MTRKIENLCDNSCVLQSIGLGSTPAQISPPHATPCYVRPFIPVFIYLMAPTKSLYPQPAPDAAVTPHPPRRAQAPPVGAYNTSYYYRSDLGLCQPIFPQPPGCDVTYTNLPLY